MNKQQLSEKWSKYCNTNKLVDDTIALLNEYGHRNTEHGVCTLLDTYFTQKEPLIEMFVTSKNYIGDMRIAVEKEFERSIDGYGLRSFFSNIGGKLYTSEMLQCKDENGKGIEDYLPTGKKVFSISELPDARQQSTKRASMQKFDYYDKSTVASSNNRKDFMTYMDWFSKYPYPTLDRNVQVHRTSVTTPALRKGTKTSRAFNQVCEHYGVDKLHPETKIVNGVEKTVYPYNKVFAEYSDLVSTLARKMKFVISLNPLDYLTMSHGVNWISCHNIRSGGCMGGTISYMLDKVSMITFVVDKLEGDIHKIPKVYRQMYHYEKNLFIQNRLYPQGNDGATNLYDKFREIVVEEFTDLLSVEGGWKHKVGPGNCTAHARNAEYSMHYPDHTYNRNATIFYPTNNEPSIMNHIMTIGHKGICVNCGKEYSYGSRLTHVYASECR